jgi:hypothetical protein
MKRRNFLTSMSALPLLSAGLPTIAATQKSQRALIVIWLDGGMSHLDTFDGKPEAPIDIRGDLVSRESSLEGVFLSEHLPQLSASMKHCCLVRSLTGPEGNHDRGSYHVLTGHRLSPVITHPSFGALLGHDPKRLADRNPIPSYVAIPDAHPYSRQGFLPATRAPFELGGTPGSQGFAVRNLPPASGTDRAMTLLEKIDALDAGPQSDAEAARDDFLRQARHLSLQPEARALFDVSRETPAIRQRYGGHTFGQSCLLARRLVEGGVSTVLVRDRGWDHHRGIKSSLTFGYPAKLDAVDQAVSALREDLERSGLDQRVTVLLASEFGRTPRLNAAGGRDHWPRASSALLFGAGLQRGVVVGTTDARGEEPIERPVSPENLFHTVLRALDIDTDRALAAPNGRPIPIVSKDSEPISEILA